MKHPLLSLLEKPSRLVIGLMSGTSADGIDAVLAQISGYSTATRIQQLGFISISYAAKVRQEILRLAGGETASAADFSRINFLLGQLHVEACDALCAQSGVSQHEIDLIGCHGQTFWHIPQPEAYLGHTQRSTLQLGEAALLSEHFGCPTVSDFRVRDVAAGGLGAPLVPYTEFLLYRSETDCIALQNIGGIGNVTILPAGCSLSDVHAFDTGPGNMLIDAAVARITGGRCTYDDGGQLARQGQIHDGLLRWLMDDPYLQMQPPKTTGREAYGAAFMDRLWRIAADMQLSELDVLATLTRFTPETIAFGIRHFAADQPSRLIVGGGGCMNQTLMAHLKALLPHCQVLVNEDLGFDSNAKEALAFAILANECIFASCNNAPGATGARHPVVMGKISL